MTQNWKWRDEFRRSKQTQKQVVTLLVSEMTFVWIKSVFLYYVWVKPRIMLLQLHVKAKLIMKMLRIEIS